MKASFSPALQFCLLILLGLASIHNLFAQLPPPPPPPGTGGGSAGVIIDGILGKRDSTFLKLNDCEEVIQDSFLVIKHTYRLEVDTNNLNYLDMTLALTDLQGQGLLGNFQGKQDSVYDGFFDFYNDTATVPFLIRCDSSGCFLYFTLFFSSNFPAPPADTAIFVNLTLEAKGQYESFFQIYVPICPETREYEEMDPRPRAHSRQGQWTEGWKVFPNPFDRQLTLQGETQNLNGLHFMLFDSQGKLWQSAKGLSAGASIRWHTESLAPGIYFLKIEAADGLSRYQKLIKVK